MDQRQWEQNGVEPQPCKSMPVLLGVLSGTIRYEIVIHLARMPSNVGLLAQRLDLSVPHVSHNLGILRRCGIVEAVQIKKERFYRLGSAVMFQLTGNSLVIELKSCDGAMLKIHAPLQQGSSSRLADIRAQ